MSELKQINTGEEEKISGLSLALDKIFHFTDKGSTAGREVKAGVSVFLISVCALFMNIQILIEAFSDNIPYCGLYLGATLVSFFGTLLLGFICNLPLVQTASLSLSTVMMSMLGTNSGLTYANLLAVTFVAAVVYLIVTLIPALRKFIFNLLPKSVRAALPVAMGLYIAYTALEKMGIIEGMALTNLSDDALGGGNIAPYMRLCVIAGLIAFALVLFNKKRKAETPVYTGFYVATLLFFLIAAVTGGIAFSYVITQNRIWIGVNPDPLGEMYTIGLGLKELQLATVFKEGFDFTAFTAAGGNITWLFIRGILLFLFLGMYESEASVQGANLNEQIYEEKEYEEKAGRFLVANAITNVIAPIFGSAPLAVGKQSAVAATDGGKTGLSSVICSIGYLISMFTWIPFVLLATYTQSVPEYGHAGFVFPNVIHAAFQIADAVMLVMGLMMLKGVKKIAGAEFSEVAPFAVTIVMTLFTQNIAYGAAAGVITAVFLSLVSFNKTELKSLKAYHYVMAVLSVVLLALSFFTPVASGSTTASSGSAGTAAVTDSTGFKFDGTTGDFSFTGEESAEYYTVWVYPVEDGVEAETYVAGSQRLTGTVEITGTIDISTLSYGDYHAVLNTFMSSGSNPEPVVIDFGVSGKLTTPEFKYTQDGTAVTVSLYDGTLTTYNESEKFTDITVTIYDQNGTVVSTEIITEADMTATQMGPFTQYTAEKTITLDAGNYQISMMANGDGNYAAPSDESEKIDLAVADGATSEGMTSGYVVEDSGN